MINFKNQISTVLASGKIVVRQSNVKMDGSLFDNKIIIIDKPHGHASHEITTFVRRITGACRSGHAGTLDPQVSGVLPVALGRATKLLRYVAGKDKTYIGIIKFRIMPDKAMVTGLFRQFTGTIVQTPPKISAVRKIPRKRTVHALDLLEISGRLALFEAKVDAGTYIRTLCDDIGKKCGGARMEELRRIAVGRITEKEAYTVQELIDAIWMYKNRGDPSFLEKMLHYPEEFIDFPKAFIKESAVDSVFSGAQIMVPAVDTFDEEVHAGERVSLYAMISGKPRFIGIGITEISSSEIKKRKRGIAVRLERVHKQEAV